MKENSTNETMLDSVKSDLENLEQAVSQGSKLRLIKLTIRSGVKAGGPFKPKTTINCPQPLYGVPNGDI
jgi:cystathionine beta-lyase/cystathionine gamma-synthase